MENESFGLKRTGICREGIQGQIERARVLKMKKNMAGVHRLSKRLGGTSKF
jgi:hypothetical protein